MTSHPFTFAVGDLVTQTLTLWGGRQLVRTGTVRERRHVGFTGAPWEAKVYPSYLVDYGEVSAYTDGRDLVKIGADHGPLFAQVAP